MHTCDILYPFKAYNNISGRRNEEELKYPKEVTELEEVGDAITRFYINTFEDVSRKTFKH